MAAVFEERRGQELDDTLPLQCTIEEAQLIGSHIEYKLKVQRGWSKDDVWEFTRRYSDFHNLHQEVQMSGLDLPLPPKKMFGNTDRMFIAERKAALQVYLECILREPVLACQLCVKRFLDPTSYAASMDEEALRQVSMFFRNEPTWEVVERLPSIGWRFRRHYYIVRARDAPKQAKHLLTLLPPGPQLFLGDKDLTNVLKHLPNLIHPNILPVQFSTWNNSAAMVVQAYYEQGSIKDAMYGKVPRPKLPYMKKYALRGRGLSLIEIRKYGRQVLDAVKFLHDKNIPFTSFHAGNIFIDGANVRLAGIETALLGVPSPYRHYVITLRKIQTKQAEASYTFGHLLYEMTFGEPLKVACVEQVPPTCHPEIKPILEMLITSAGCKAGMPSLGALLGSAVFPELPSGLMDAKPQFKVGSKLKEALRSARESAEVQLQDEQKKVSQLKRINTAKEKEKALSEEEKRRRMKARKKSLVTTQSVGAAESQRSPAASPKTTTKQTSKKSLAIEESPPSSQQTSRSASPVPPAASGERGALLTSISGFSKKGLKKTVTVDRSAPMLY